MAYDGLVTEAVVWELKENILLGKIEKVYQPEKDELVLNIHSKKGNFKVFASSGSSHARVHFIDGSPVNPPAPLAFCMLLRKHLQGGRITEIIQKDSERIIEFHIETLNELGFNVSKKLIFEIMGKHSNIVLVDAATGKILDAIKRVSFDVNRARQILPGIIYEYPPKQDKVPYKELLEGKSEDLEDILKANKGAELLRKIGGISPALAEEIASREDKIGFLIDIKEKIESNSVKPNIYYSDKEEPVEFHILKLDEYEKVCRVETFESISRCLEKYFSLRESSNQGKQKSHDLIRAVNANLDKMYLKKKRLSEDLIKAENSEDLRLFGELITANLHMIKTGMRTVDLINYYNGEKVTVNLNPKDSPSKNAQQYFKKYGKAKTAVKEKQLQLEENQGEILYLESVLTFLENTDDIGEIESLRRELVETGYLRKRKERGGYKEKADKPKPHRYLLESGATILVGRNNKENDILTFKTGSKTDLWLHTKDIPGSHVILKAGEKEISDEDIVTGCEIAAYHSKARGSENVPVDYVPIKYVKKPAGAKPGMVIFTNNRTVWVNPKLPKSKE